MSQIFASLAEFLRDLGGSTPSIVTGAGAEFIVARKDQFEALDLERYRATPRHRRASPQFDTVDSFASYVLKHEFGAQERLEVYVDGEPSRASNLFAIAVFDGLSPNDHHGSWFRHRAVLALSHSSEFQKWQRALGLAALDQVALAETLEDLAHTIVAPVAADLAEAIQNMAETRTVKFAAKTSLRDGMRSFVYTEDDGGPQGQIRVPAKFRVRLPFFRSSPAPTEFDILLRYRWSSEQKPRFTLVAPGLQRLVEADLKDHYNALAVALPDIPLLLGRPRLPEINV